MQMQKFTVHFDDGPSIQTQLKSRDLAKLEEEGVDLSETPPIRGTYILAFTALERMKRQGTIDVDLPKDVQGLIDVADIDVDEDPDVEGEGSGQVAVTG
jgi:hypothetical protein